MALTMLPPPSEPVRGDRSAFMTPEVRMEGARTVVVLRGGTDVATKPVLCDVLSRVVASAGGDVVIDLGAATFIDIATARVLATAQQLLDGQNRQLTFRSPSRLAARLLHVFELTDLIEAKRPPMAGAPNEPSVHLDGLDSEMDQARW